MTLLLKQLFAFLKLLNSDQGTNQIAAGIACGFVLGMTPFFSLQSLLIFLCIFIFRIQPGAAFISAFFFSFIAYVLDPIFHRVGAWVLELEPLNPLFTKLYNMPIVPLTRFNNTIVMGSGVAALALTPFIFILSRYVIVKYRVTIVARFKQTKFWQAVQATSFYKWYYTYDNLYGQ